MRRPKPVIFVDTEEERAELFKKYRGRRARALITSVVWSVVAVPLYAELRWLWFIPFFDTGGFPPWWVWWLIGMSAIGVAIVKLADSKGLTRGWGLIALAPFAPPMFVTYLVGALGLLLLCLIPVSQKVPNIRLRSESNTWGS